MTRNECATLMVALTWLIASVPAAAADEDSSEPPDAPWGLFAVWGDDNATVLLQWQEPLDEGGGNMTGYNVYRATLANSSSSMSIVGTANNTTTFIDELGDAAEDPAAVFMYYVTAVNEAGEGNESNPAFMPSSASAGIHGCISLLPIGSIPPVVTNLEDCLPPILESCDNEELVRVVNDILEEFVRTLDEFCQ